LRHPVFEGFETDICLILINLEVELNHLTLCNSYSSLQSDIYCIMKLHLRTITRPPELFIFTLYCLSVW